VTRARADKPRAGQRPEYRHGVDTEPATDPGTDGDRRTLPTAGDRRPWFVFGAMSLPLLALSVDINGIGTVLPSVQRDLDVSPGTISWLVSTTSLTMAATLILVGRVAPRIGNRRLVLVGIVLFGAASLLCGVAPEFWSLVGARVGQGLGGVLMFTTSLAVINAVFDERHRPAAVGAWGLVNGVGGALGPLVAGAATTVSWRLFFLLNVPLCAVAFLVVARLTPRDAPTPSDAPLPLVRLVLLGVALVALTWGLQSSSDAGWTAPETIAALVSAGTIVVGLALFSRAVTHRARGGAHDVDRSVVRAARAPVLSPSVVHSPRLLAANVVAFTANWGFGIVIVAGGLYLQLTHALSPLESGLVFTSFSAACALAGVCISPLHRRLGSARAMVAAMVIVSVSLGVGAVILQTSTALVVVAGFLALAGFGQGLAFDLSTLAALEGVPEGDAAEAASVISVVRSTGFTVGIALSTALGLAVSEATSATDVAHGVRSVLGLAAVVSLVGIAGALVHQRTPRTPSPNPTANDPNL